MSFDDATNAHTTIPIGTQCGPDDQHTIASLTPDTYRYEPLTDARSIRLLRIDVSSPQPSLSLVEVGINTAPSYIAVSYVWGDPTTAHHLLLPGGTLGFTASLNDALVDIIQFHRASKDESSEYSDL